MAPAPAGRELSPKACGLPQLTIQVVRVWVEAAGMLERRVEAEVTVAHKALAPELKPGGHHLGSRGGVGWVQGARGMVD